MKTTYDLTVSTIDERGRVRFRPSDLAEDAKEPDADVGLTLRFDEGAKHGFMPGQRVKVTLEG